MLGLKLVLVPALIGLASWAGRRWGSSVGGWLAALPLTSGPVVLILALEQGPAFAAHTANWTLLGLVSLCMFAVTYGWSARAWPWWASITTGYAAYLVVAGGLGRISSSLPGAFAAAILSVLLAAKALPAVPGAPPRATAMPPWEIPLRMLAGAVMVAVITGAASVAGSRLSGLLTPFPVVAGILAAFAHRREGPDGAVRLLHGLTLGLTTFAAFFLVVGLLLPLLGMLPTFLCAAMVGVAAHLAVLRFVLRAQEGRTALGGVSPGGAGEARFEIVDAHREPGLRATRALIREYASSLGISLEFENFDQELAHLPGAYQPPTGCLLLAILEGREAGCVGLRSWAVGTAEIKRLYVRPEFRGRGVGRGLAITAVKRAALMGYRSVRLDTLPSMQAAQQVYKSLGFVEIDPYRYNPLEGARFFELDLCGTARTDAEPH